jgi:hypothetical protein
VRAQLLADNLSLILEGCVMARLIIDYVALDIDAGIDPDGIAVLTLVTDRGPVGVQLSRAVFDTLGARIKRELERVPPPAGKR